MAALARAGARIALDGLTGHEVGELLAGHPRGPRPSLAAVLTRRTEGNPFYVLELVRLLQARGTVDPAEAAALPVPEGA